MAEERDGRGRLSSIDQLPDEAQDDIVWACGELNQRQRTQADILFELNDRLAVKGLGPISRSAFNRKSMHLARLTRRLDESRHIFSGLADQFTPEKVDHNNIVIGEVIKLLVFELAQSDGSQIEPKGAMELARAFLASVQAQGLSAKRRAALEQEFATRTEKAIEAVSVAAGLSADRAAQIRRDVLGLRDKPTPAP